MALFIKFDGIEGEAKDKDHKGWTDLLSVSGARILRRTKDTY